jgi:hypothetical protein
MEGIQSPQSSISTSIYILCGRNEGACRTALNPNTLSRNELVQLLNPTALGECLTRSRPDRQMNRAGRRWHDGRHVRLLDYLRWLVR